VVGIGGVVGVIVLAVFLPIFKLSTMGGGANR
jgi:type II secretory pathway component PulF